MEYTKTVVDSDQIHFYLHADQVAFCVANGQELLSHGVFTYWNIKHRTSHKPTTFDDWLSKRFAKKSHPLEPHYFSLETHGGLRAYQLINHTGTRIKHLLQSKNLSNCIYFQSLFVEAFSPHKWRQANELANQIRVLASAACSSGPINTDPLSMGDLDLKLTPSWKPVNLARPNDSISFDFSTL